MSWHRSGGWIIDGDTLLVCFAMLLLCFGVVRSGHETFTLNWNLQLLLTNGFLLIASRRINLSAWDLTPFLLVAVLEIPVQWVFGAYYSWRSSLFGIFTLGMTILTVSLVVRRGFGRYIWHVINLVSLFAVACLYVQIVFRLVGIRLDKIPMFANSLFKAWEFTTSFRPCAVFSEPSHLAELCLLSTFYYLLIDKNLRRAIVLIGGMIFSTSALGILGSVFLMTLYVITLDRNSHLGSIKKWLIILTAMVVCIVVLLWVANTDNWVVERILAGGTSSTRIWRAFDLFFEMDSMEKLVGIGIQNAEIYLNHYQIILDHDTYETIKVNREFMQTLGYILCTTGILGFGAFLYSVVRMLITMDYKVKYLCLLFLFVCFTCCIFSRQIFAVYLIAIYATRDIIWCETKSMKCEAS